MEAKNDIVKGILQQEALKQTVLKSQNVSAKPWKNDKAKIQETPFGNWDSGAPNKKFVKKELEKPARNFNEPASINVSIPFPTIFL